MLNLEGIIHHLLPSVIYYINLEVYQPVYNMGPEGFEPSTASAPGLYPQIIYEIYVKCGWYPTKLDDSPYTLLLFITSFKPVLLI